ncbi:D-glucuronyl C5-epimerase-like protein [Dinothrombium tinctorium]|uniref:heparosan-N-sulfate-glucuronate 5-epimerase n=1 Tax=Dinothrombium tinctorium TaxID=1965070 RepID=A0A3S4RHS8_9ACAR|nr:D-glucuronyl C5-epimerase-like protein [Dinothrombium tinctorium]RWS16341.1 D-glucuronyl C5-epimerase-like protein [Dinothrombium tinctorium]RWS16842.1 D-glucuronyl C5-epimerase-like protein [Dinothrombium tinctorium]RWS16862.1 D-glucuronyl C5-epimerase-like protein [Dinothrombium tinctorium]
MKFRVKKTLILSLATLGVFVVCWNVFAFLDKVDNNQKLFLSSLKQPKRSEESKALKLKFEESESFAEKLYDKSARNYKFLDCLINDEYSVRCLKHGDSVFVPFNFIRKYFEINGKLTKKADGKEYFNWQHSYSKIYSPRQSYDFKGPYLWFENYNVEVRERVKSISAMYGVPISTQWDAKGHFYPIQIAQFGLSHYSKNLTGGKPRVLILETGEFNLTNWQLEVKGNGFQIKSQSDEELKANNKVLFIEGESVALKMKKRKSHNDLTLSLKVKPLSNFTFSVILQSDGAAEYSVSYSTIDYDIFDEQIVYGIGSNYSWKFITRDVGVDLQKAFAFANRKLGVKPRNLHIIKFIFNGKALLDDVILSSSAHEAHFKAAVKWMISNQDEIGGWPIKVTRRLSNGALVLKPGWYSAMAQGQAISLLTRMYHVTQDETYLNAAKKAVNLFAINATDHGIRTYFLDKFIWFEEYPTTPSSFVLNGFIYSLFGLYDLSMACKKQCEEVNKLYEAGIASLKKMLPLFDTGSGTLYDLRHVSLGIAPNLARWDYHSTHINQLLFLNTIESNSMIQATTKRWISYMKGKRAPHN